MSSPTFLNPLGLLSSTWLISEADHDKEVSENEAVDAGFISDFTSPNAPTGNPENLTTTVVNNAPQSATFAASNQSTSPGAVGLYGESKSTAGAGLTAGVGVMGASSGIGVAGVSSSGGTDVTSKQGIGVLGAGDSVGVQGNGPIGVSGIGLPGVSGSGNVAVMGVSTGVPGKSVPNASDPKLMQTGVVGVGAFRGGIFQALTDFNTGTADPAVTGTPELANIQLTPVAADTSSQTPTTVKFSGIPVLPQGGSAGDMLVVQLVTSKLTGTIDPTSTQLWLCTTSATLDGTAVKSPAKWSRVVLDIAVIG